MIHDAGQHLGRWQQGFDPSVAAAAAAIVAMGGDHDGQYVGQPRQEEDKHFDQMAQFTGQVGIGTEDLDRCQW